MMKLLFAFLIGAGVLYGVSAPSYAQFAKPKITVAQVETCMELCLRTKKSREACRIRCQNRPGN